MRHDVCPDPAPSLYERSRVERLEIAGQTLEVAIAHVSSSAPRRLLLLHGNPSNLAHWSPVMNELIAIGSVLAIDLPGFGNSEAPRGPLGLEVLADAARAAMDAVGWSDAIAIGHSHGGAVAQTFAAYHPERVRGVVAIGSIGFPSHIAVRLARLPGAEALMSFGAHRAARASWRNITSVMAKILVWTSFAPDPIPAGFVERELARISERPEIQRSAVRCSQSDLSEQLVRLATSIRSPILVLHGQNDRLIPVKHARGLRAALEAAGARVRYVEVEGGHMIHVTRPSSVWPCVAAWIASEID